MKRSLFAIALLMLSCTKNTNKDTAIIINKDLNILIDDYIKCIKKESTYPSTIWIDFSMRDSITVVLLLDQYSISDPNDILGHTQKGNILVNIIGKHSQNFIKITKKRKVNYYTKEIYSPVMYPYENIVWVLYFKNNKLIDYNPKDRMRSCTNEDSLNLAILKRTKYIIN